MKKSILILFVLFLFIGAKIPVLVQVEGCDYKLVDWEGGDFVFVSYSFKGGKFEDALLICREFGNIVKERNINETAIGMFPDLKNWKLGMIAKDKFDMTGIKGFKIERSKVESGKYAVMTFKGYPESMFKYYAKFKKRLIADGYKVTSPVYEVYTYDTFNNEALSIEERIGEIRYKVER